MGLLEFTDRGIYCPAADVYLDPWNPVKKALITHGHSDHAHWGHDHYLCSTTSAPIVRHRLQLTDKVQPVNYGEPVKINGVSFSFHPAGHIPGSAQIRVEHRGEVWVFSGDYKVEADGISEPFEVVPCHTFITESTFGLPVYQWPRQQNVFNDINQWWRQNRTEGRTSVLAAYTLGKSQRLLKNIDGSIGPIYVHGAVDAMNRVVREAGIDLPDAQYLTAGISKKELAAALVFCPPSAIGSPWMDRFPEYSLGVASGWMALRGTRRRRGADRGFVLSDHADWPGLNQVIEATGASRVYVTHGYTDLFAAWLNDKGIEAYEAKTDYEGERVEGSTAEE